MKVLQLSLAIATTLVVTQGVNAKPVHISQNKDMFVAINYNPGSYQSRRNRSRFMNRVRRDRFNRTQTNRNRVIKSPRFLPNLQVSSISWGGEFCNLSHRANKLKRIGINKATCPIVVRVMNTGRMRSRPVMVSLTYTRGDGVRVRRSRMMSAVAAGGFSTSKLVSFRNIGIYRIDRPFIVKVDVLNKTPESNEADNVKAIIFSR